METLKINIPFYLDEQHHQQIFEVDTVKAYRNWLSKKLNTGSNGICYGDTYIGKSAVTMDFIQQHSGIDYRTANQTVPIIYHYPCQKETYKWTLKEIALDLSPWVIGSAKLIKDGNTAYWEEKVAELLSAASTRLIVIDEISRYSHIVMVRLLKFLTSTVPTIGVILIDYTPKIQWKLSREPLLTEFSDHFIFSKLTDKETLELCRLWEKETLGSHYLNWKSELGRKAIITSEGHTGRLVGVLKRAYYDFIKDKAKIALKVANNEKNESWTYTYEEYKIQRELLEQTCKKNHFIGETDVQSLTKALLLKLSKISDNLHKPTFAFSVPEDLITELDNNLEAATIVHTIRERDTNTILDVPKKYQPNQDYRLVENLPPLLHDPKNIINPDYYHETVAELGTTANTLAIMMNWFIPNTYTRNGLRCPDFRKAKKKLKELEIKGYVVTKPGSYPAAYISKEVFQVIIKKTKLNLDSTI